ncbi:hypothetical protein BH10PSE19_BH10PSE19_19540 [soil metagenome]
MKNKTMLHTTIAAMVAVAMGSLSSQAHAEMKGEKCYGIVKAHKNDCAVKNGHSCAALSPKDNDPNEWIMVPKGVCDKITGGSLTPVGATPAAAAVTTQPNAAVKPEVPVKPEVK